METKIPLCENCEFSGSCSLLRTEENRKLYERNVIALLLHVFVAVLGILLICCTDTYSFSVVCFLINSHPVEKKQHIYKM